MTIVITAQARKELGLIWDWNAERYSIEHANRYIAFLIGEAEAICDNLGIARPVPRRKGLQYILIRAKPRGHGHVAIFRKKGDVLEIVHYFHTAQNWRKRL